VGQVVVQPDAPARVLVQVARTGVGRSESMPPCAVHFNGSVNLPDAEAVMRTISERNRSVAQDVEVARRLWELSARLTDIATPVPIR
jgi:hypothetical protein